MLGSSPLFPREQRSLFGEILDWMLVPLLVIWPMSVVLTYLVAQNIANRPFDRGLQQNAQALAHFMEGQSGRGPLIIPRAVHQILRADQTDEIYYQIGRQGLILSGESSLDLALKPPPGYNSGEVLFRNALVNSQDVRVAYLWIELDGDPQPILVQVGETLAKRKLLATEIIKGVTIPQFVIFPLALLMVWLALSRAIRPLSSLEKNIRARSPQDMSPIEAGAVPQEVIPLVASINDMVERLKQSILTQKRFLADAAHQLKTPLAGLRMQAELAQRESDNPTDLKRSLYHIGQSSVRATHTVNQLLALARADTGANRPIMMVCDIFTVAKIALEEVVTLAVNKNIALNFDSAEPAVNVMGNANMLKEMLRNLLDNAIAYTPNGGEVTLRLLPDRFGKIVLIQVEDTGPGINAAEQELVFEPFYRSLGTAVDGSGLGLSIVKEIATQHHIRLTIEPARPQHKTAPGVRFNLMMQTV